MVSLTTEQVLVFGAFGHSAIFYKDLRLSGLAVLAESILAEPVLLRRFEGGR